MKQHLSENLNDFRIVNGPWGTKPFSGPTGAYRIPRNLLCHRHIGRIHVIAHDGEGTGWEHVSVSVQGMSELPLWGEMCHVKRLFWLPTEAAFQFHPPAESYVNNAEVLHLWRPTEKGLHLPPPELVGVPNLGSFSE